MAKYKCKKCESVTEGGATAPVQCPHCPAKFKMMKVPDDTPVTQKLLSLRERGRG